MNLNYLGQMLTNSRSRVQRTVANNTAQPLREAIWLNEQSIARAAQENHTETLTLTKDQVDEMSPKAVARYMSHEHNIYGSDAAEAVQKVACSGGHMSSSMKGMAAGAAMFGVALACPPAAPLALVGALGAAGYAVLHGKVAGSDGVDDIQTINLHLKEDTQKATETFGQGLQDTSSARFLRLSELTNRQALVQRVNASPGHGLSEAFSDPNQEWMLKLY